MKEKIINTIMININNKNELDKIKQEEIKYGLLGLYTLITKTSVIILLSIFLGFFKNFLIFFIFYAILRGVGFGTHAKNNITCWIFSIVLLLGIPYLFSNIYLNNTYKSILWFICFINYVIFCPADTDKRPMINKIRKLKFKISILIISIIYLILLFKFENIASLIISSMILESLLTNPIGYILMGQKVRFKLNDINLFKQNVKKGGIL